MKTTNIYTDRFETVLPTKELQRVVAPWLSLCNQPVTRETLDLIRAQHEEFRKVCEPPAPPPKPAAVRRSGFPRWPLGLVMVLSAVLFIALALTSRKNPPVTVLPLVESPGWPAESTLVPAPAPAPSEQSEADWQRRVKKYADRIAAQEARYAARIANTPSTPVPAPAIEVRRAELTGYFWVQMPDSEWQRIRLLGHVNVQEQLPFSGNVIGDAYAIGREVFVWVSPGQWIDPVVKLPGIGN
jgi:hypothetical protein